MQFENHQSTFYSLRRALKLGFQQVPLRYPQESTCISTYWVRDKATFCRRRYDCSRNSCISSYEQWQWEMYGDLSSYSAWHKAIHKLLAITITTAAISNGMVPALTATTVFSLYWLMPSERVEWGSKGKKWMTTDYLFF